MKKIILIAAFISSFYTAKSICVSFAMDMIRNNYGNVGETKNEFGDIHVNCSGAGTLDCQASDGTCPNALVIQDDVFDRILSGELIGEGYFEDDYYTWDAIENGPVNISVYLED